LVYDLGSYACRVGYSGDDAPKCVIQPVLGMTRQGEHANYHISEMALRYYRENTKIGSVVGSNGASRIY